MLRFLQFESPDPTRQEIISDLEYIYRNTLKEPDATNADGNLLPVSEAWDFLQLLNRSSLGTPEVRERQASTSPTKIQEILAPHINRIRNQCELPSGASTEKSSAVSRKDRLLHDITSELKKSQDERSRQENETVDIRPWNPDKILDKLKFSESDAIRLELDLGRTDPAALRDEPATSHEHANLYAALINIQTEKEIENEKPEWQDELISGDFLKGIDNALHEDRPQKAESTNSIGENFSYADACRTTQSIHIDKILISGGPGVGSTTFIRSISEMRPIDLDEIITEASSGITDLEFTPEKQRTTTSMDFGLVESSFGTRLRVFGLPSQPRFWHTWPDLSAGSAGGLILCDTRRLDMSFHAIDFFEREGIPFGIIVNVFDDHDLYNISDIRTALAISAKNPVYKIDARDREVSSHAFSSFMDFLVIKKSVSPGPQAIFSTSVTPRAISSTLQLAKGPEDPDQIPLPTRNHDFSVAR